MENNIILLDKQLKNCSKVLSGRTEGYDARKRLQIDKYDKENIKITIEISVNVYSINPSFFLGLFGESIKALGEKGFRDKYSFECSISIKRNVEEGIIRATNAYF